MNIEEEINNILFKIGKEIKIHKISGNDMIIEIDYKKYTNELVELFKLYNEKEY